jgi:SAM-dependent methyltransferase
LVARWWSEFAGDFRSHEIPYFRRHIERDGQPALDVGCGTGRLLLPYLRTGLDVDGCDVSADMIALCREKVVLEGLSTNLYVQAMHELELPRRYKTIFVCGAFGLGSTRDQDVEALRRIHEHLEPGGTVLIDIEVPYADAKQWRCWLRQERSALPETAERPSSRRLAANGAEYAIRSRIIEMAPLEQRITLAMNAEEWREGVLHAEEEHLLTMGLYFGNELRLMLECAGFANVVVEGDHNDREGSSDDAFLVLVAKK